MWGFLFGVSVGVAICYPTEAAAMIDWAIQSIHHLVLQAIASVPTLPPAPTTPI